MSRRLLFGGEAVAKVALTGLFNDILEDVHEGGPKAGEYIADQVIGASSVEYRPNARKLVLTFDLSEAAPQSALEDVAGRTCPVIINGEQCTAAPGHELPHVFE